jgi:hypothetical protein
MEVKGAMEHLVEPNRFGEPTENSGSAPNLRDPIPIRLSLINFLSADWATKPR